jgi:hypothetical protein
MQMQTCDVLICSGRGKLPYRIQEYNRLMRARGESADMTHVALAAGGGQLVFESTANNRWAGKKGTQINPIDKWLDHYPGRVWVRPLYFDRTAAFEEEAANAMWEKVGRPYEHGIPGLLELAACGIEWPWLRRLIDADGRMATWALHCSEAAAKVLMELSLMRSFDCAGNRIYANKLPPYEWWLGGRVDGLLNPNCCRIGDPVRLK